MRTLFASVLLSLVLALPVALSDKGEPVGLQLIGRPFAEAEILNIASALEGRLPSIGSPLQKA